MKTFLIVISIITVLTVGMQSFRSAQTPDELPADHALAPNVTTFAYDSLRSGSTISHLADGTRFTSRKVPFQEATAAYKFMPLYLNTTKQPVPGLEPDAHLIYFTHLQERTALRIYSLEKESLVRDVMIPRHLAPTSTPLINPQTGRLYYLSSMTGPPQKSLSTRHHLVSVGLDGKNFDVADLRISSLLRQTDKRKKPRLEERVHCKTAPSLISKEQATTLAFGCSISTNSDLHWRYGEHRGLTGLAVFVDVDAKGSLMPKTLRGFRVSESSAIADTGFDGGIYQSGGAPAALPNGDTLFATGNGPYYPRDQSFGCSVIRLDPQTAKVKTVADEPQIIGLNDLGSNECWSSNDEYSSSAVSVAPGKVGLVGSIMSKYGRLRMFNVDQMAPSSQGREQEVSLGSSINYGQPVSIGQKDGSVRAFVSFNPSHPAEIDMFWTTKPQVNHHHQCLGLTLAKAQTGSTRLVNFYSGRLRSDHVTVPESVPLFKEMTAQRSSLLGESGQGYMSAKLASPFHETGTLGWTVPKDIIPPAGFVISPLPDFRNTFSVLSRARIINESTESFYLLIRKDSPSAKTCQGNIPAGFEPLYLASKKDSPQSAPAKIFAVDSSGSETPQIAWERTPLANLQFDRTHSLVLLRSPVSERIVVFVTGFQIDPSSNQRQSVFFLLDAEDGHLLHIGNFEGVQHFAMPLVVGNEVFIPTLENGIQRIRLEGHGPWWRDLLRSANNLSLFN